MAETIKKAQYKVEITTMCGETVTADDATVSGQGVAAYMALDRGMKVVVREDGKITIVPFHAVCKADVTITSTDVEKPEDTVCVTDDDSSDGEG